MRILISFQYFTPAYKAGGPTQSIKNLAEFLVSGRDDIEVYILCSNRDLDNTILDVEPDKWAEYKQYIHVFYNSNGKLGISDTIKIIHKVAPDVIFINGLYALIYTIYPLIYKGECRKILSVRGMLHPGALSQKKLKKRVFLNAFKLLKLHRKCEYHSTGDIETQYIQNEFGKNAQVWMIPNLPNVLEYQSPPIEYSDRLMLVSIALISPMKNILLVLESLRKCKHSVVYHIYGPIKDAGYWQNCLAVIETLPQNIIAEYKGEVEPHNIPETLKSYQAFILPSKSENFGHAIFESLSAGKPVITSHNTPWNHLQENNAGYNVNPDNIHELTDAIDNLCNLNSEDWIVRSKSAREYVLGKYDLSAIKKGYNNMFSLS